MPGEGFNKPWTSLIHMGENKRKKTGALFGK